MQNNNDGKKKKKKYYEDVDTDAVRELVLYADNEVENGKKVYTIKI